MPRIAGARQRASAHGAVCAHDQHVQREDLHAIVDVVRRNAPVLLHQSRVLDEVLCTFPRRGLTVD